jgi:hypothetical protein
VVILGVVLEDLLLLGVFEVSSQIIGAEFLAPFLAVGEPIKELLDHSIFRAFPNAWTTGLSVTKKSQGCGENRVTYMVLAASTSNLRARRKRRRVRVSKRSV